MTTKKSEKKAKVEMASWVDKQILSRVWVGLLEKSVFSMVNGEYRLYKRGIDILTNTLFKTEREKVLTYRESFDHMDMEAYFKIQAFIIDLLEEKGYMRYSGKNKREENFEGWEDQQKEEKEFDEVE